MAGQPFCAKLRAAWQLIRRPVTSAVVIGGAVVCAMCVAAARHATGLLHLDPPVWQTAPASSRGGVWQAASPRPATGPHVDCTVFLAEDDRLVIGSLDREARWHHVTIAQRALPQTPTEHTACAEQMSAAPWCAVDKTVIERNRPQDNCTQPLTDECRSGSNNCTPTAGAPRPSSGIACELNPSPAEERRFRLPRFQSDRAPLQTAGYASDRVALCRQVAQSESVRLYTTDFDLSAHSICRLITVIEDRILPSVTEQVGQVADVDGDDHLSVVVCRLSDDTIRSQVPLLGCVRAADFLKDGPLHGDIIYLDSRLLKSEALPAVVTHEMAHAAVFSMVRNLSVVRNPGDADRHVTQLPGWLNEAIAHSCEFHCYPSSPNLSDRIANYLHDPGHWPLVHPKLLRPDLSGRGPMRAAGLFYVEYLRRETTLPKLIECAVTLNQLSEFPAPTEFAESFRRWTVWMSDQQQRGLLSLKVRPLTSDQTTRDVALRGTAATWWQASHSGVFTISAAPGSELQLTVIKADGEPARVVEKSASSSGGQSADGRVGGSD